MCLQQLIFFTVVDHYFSNSASPYQRTHWLHTNLISDCLEDYNLWVTDSMVHPMHFWSQTGVTCIVYKCLQMSSVEQ